MKQYLPLAAIACIIASAAFAERIRDWSLPPEQSMREPDIVRPEGSNPFEPWHSELPSGSAAGPGFPGLSKQQPSATERAERGSNGKFMHAYCDPNFRPMVTARGGISACLQDLRDKACDQFDRLPPDAQRVLDHAVDCAYTANELEGAKLDPSCADDDSMRIGLIRKYWEDRDTAQAVVFLPDMILNGGSFCMHDGAY